MSLKFIEEFDSASSKIAPGSRGIGILNIFTVVGCIIAVPFTFGASLFGLLAVPIYAALQSIANETYRTRLFTEIQTQIIAEKEGLFITPRLRRRVSSPPIYEDETIDETKDIDKENSDDDGDN
tara:strand:+ start:145 stop:516 length:372 start_codon:yes stop_codon:yes gene_type:complete